MAKDGTVLKTRLEVSVDYKTDAEATQRFEQKLAVYPEDPTAELTTWLEELDIYLLDKLGNTSDHCESLQIPIQQIDRLSQIPTDRPVTLIVGEGVLLDENPSLAKGFVFTCVVWCSSTLAFSAIR